MLFRIRMEQSLLTCTKCKPGFYGINCSSACLFPYYGEGCQQECVCSKEECDISIGCQGKSTTTTIATTKATIIATTTHFYTARNYIKRSITSDHNNFKTSVNSNIRLYHSRNHQTEYQRYKTLRFIHCLV